MATAAQLHPDHQKHVHQVDGPKHGRKCLSCEIRIFRSAGQARLAGVPFIAYDNLDLDGRCPPCAGSIDIPAFIEAINTDSLPNKRKVLNMDAIEFDGVELNVEPPEAAAGRTSKYDPLQKTLLDSPAGAWHRLKLPEKQLVRRVAESTRRRFRGRHWSFRTVPNKSGVYLYWQWSEKEEETGEK